MCIAAAVIGGAVIGAAASVYSGNKAADAAKDASKQSSDTQRYMYDTTRQDMEPYRQAGTGALNQLAALYGLPQYKPQTPSQVTPQSSVSGQLVLSAALKSGRGQSGMFGFRPQNNQPAVSSSPVSQAEPDAPMEGQYIPAGKPDYSAFYNSPDYQFAYDEGMRGTEQALARQGLTGSGAALKALTRFGQGLASQQLGNYKNSLAALAGIGQTSTSQLGQLGANAAQGIAADQRAAGDARASSYLNTGAAVSGVANSGAQYAMMNQGGYMNSRPQNYLNYNQGLA